MKFYHFLFYRRITTCFVVVEILDEPGLFLFYLFIYFIVKNFTSIKYNLGVKDSVVQAYGNRSLESSYEIKLIWNLVAPVKSSGLNVSDSQLFSQAQHHTGERMLL